MFGNIGDFLGGVGGLLTDPGNSGGFMGLPSIGDTAKGITGQTGAEYALQGSRENIEFQKEALETLREDEAIPREIRDATLPYLQGVYMGGPASEAMSRSIESDPFYQSQLQQAEESILRNQSATGGLRGGATTAALSRAAPMLMQNLRNERLQGLQGLAYGAPTTGTEQAGVLSQMGNITGLGTAAAGQSLQQGAGNVASLAGGIMAMFSDPRLKDNAEKVGEHNGLNVYVWNWNGDAEKLGLKGSSVGFMADEVEELYPDLVSTDESGYKQIDIEGLING